MSIPLACSIGIRPSALVNEKCVMALEFRRMIPRPVGVTGGKIIGKTLFHSLGSALLRDGEPVALNLAMSPMCGANDCASVSPRPLRSELITWTRSP